MTTELEELASIRRLMTDAQRTAQDNGGQFIAWGVLTATGLLATYATLVIPLPSRVVAIVWPVLMTIGWIGWFLRGRGAHERALVRSPANVLLRDLWAAVGLALVILTFAGRATGAIPSSAMPGVISAGLGIGCFASATFYRAVPLRWIAALWWTGAVLMLIVRGPYTLLLMTAMVLGLQVVPGLILRRGHRAPMLDEV